MKYKLISNKYIKDISSTVKVYEHIKTHARICCFENDDPNKVFNIAFRTPAINNCGLTHILEHSVLCGSDKYPVKDPFVELMKASLNTFLNAMTFPDKTMYPCASCNDGDFKNLMSVYMDAVFYPSIYKHEEIFLQEGWHFDIANKDEPLKYNGVVYNEMRGAFSDPEQILSRQIIHSLFPDNCYQFESGGDPTYIPELSYKEFLNFHSKYYHPSNSYIFLYGKMDFEERMEWMDREYLSKFEAIDFDTTVKKQKPFSKPKQFEFKYPVATKEELKNKAMLTYNIVLPNNNDQKMMIAINTLNTVLFDNPGAPIKQALLDSGICTDVRCETSDDLLQPIVSIIGINCDENRYEEFKKIIEKEFNKLIDGKLNKEAILSCLNFAEFKKRENSFTPRYPQGLVYQITALSTWLYDDNDVTSSLETIDLFKELKSDLDKGYFEKIIKDVFLNNNHKSFVSCIPDINFFAQKEKELSNKLKVIKSKLSNKELDDLIEKKKSLTKYQKEGNTVEELNSIPKLKLNDLTSECEKYYLEVIKDKYTILFSKYPTNDIAYNHLYFKLDSLNSEDINLLSLYSNLIGQISTSKHHYSEIVNEVFNYTGGIACRLLPYSDDRGKASLLIDFTFSASKENIKKATDLVEELIFETKFDDKNRIREKLIELKTNLTMEVSGRGHSVALVRAASKCNEQFRYSDESSGLAYLDFINDLVNNFDKKLKEIKEKLESIKSSFFSQENAYIGFTGEKTLLEFCKENLFNLLNRFNYKTSYIKSEIKLNKNSEGIIAPYDVNFNAMVGTFEHKYEGSMLVLENAINLDFLWTNVRVLGGAYGCFILQTRFGVVGFTSYRDPNVEKTIDTYHKICDFIDNLSVDDDTLLKYKIGAIGNMESVLHVSGKGREAQMSFFTHFGHDEKVKLRKEIIQTNKDDLKKLKSIFESYLKTSKIVCIGKEELIKSCSYNFDKTRLLVK